ncbi:hypothetical protein [Pseudooceanicola sp. LIPI14-2-Ac024]|uniref:hypothetical protein n=1 Tax=Pseudooceanicola sp. LIPI14-2-Ac024 TaxID=3344875 RepID=UPI0035D07303
MQRVTEILKHARANGETAPMTEGDLPATEGAAYAAATACVEDVAGWKIGGANPWSREVFGNTQVFFGALDRRETYLDGDSVPTAGLVAPLAEPEIMLRLSGDADRPFDAMALGIEIPATVLSDVLKPVLRAQMTDRAGAGLLWVGPVMAFDEGALLSAFDTAFHHNDAPVIAGRSANIIGGPLGAAAEFLALARQHVMPLAAGQWVATGGLNPAVRVAAGDTVRFAALGHEVGLKFT